ncbi:hypothetical protein HGRIS_008985 [Hohenbuehelia grisea]|uniref:Uncharacterized protein n=1 Tax=Hohenbuehelia grisea TaxID=104357 RepID=A0ABR3J160_9AGAR
MYMLPYRCKVTNAHGVVPVGRAKVPAWCEDDQSKCTRGPKQMVYWNQLSGNNVEVSGDDSQGRAKSPGYNYKMGFSGGAQNDIFGL